MGKKKVIRIDEDMLRGLVEKALGRVIEGYGYDDIGVEGLFDIDSLSREDVLSMATDLRVYLMGNVFDSDLTVDGDLIINEGVSDVMGIGGLRKELGKLGFKQWQIKSEVRSNRVRTVILYADIEKNTDIIKNKMLGYGWTVSYISGVMVKEGIPLRVMGFDPADALSLIGEIKYTDKFNYKGEDFVENF